MQTHKSSLEREKSSTSIDYPMCATVVGEQMNVIRNGMSHTNSCKKLLSSYLDKGLEDNNAEREREEPDISMETQLCGEYSRRPK